MSNHLLIGLGGTGGKVLREMRKRVYEEFGKHEPGNGVFIDYVYVDSSTDDLNDRRSWKVMANSVHLGEAQKVNINGIQTGMLDNINMYPGLGAFLNTRDRQMMTEKLGQLIGQGIGGQRRRLGRTLLANNLADKTNTLNFENVIKGAVKRLQDASGEQNIVFHICAGLAGGTGSGTIVDVISQIRTWFPYQQQADADTKKPKFKICLMLYVPEQNLARTDHDNGFYQANGYSALQELNAMSIGKYHPVDITGQKDVFTGEVKRLLADTEPFEAAYVYTNVNERGKILELGTSLPAAVADFLFQIIVANEIAGGSGKMSRMEGCENDGAGPEKDQSGNNARSRKFLSFGIARIEYPETEIKEYVAYNYAIQSARQLTYNFWQEGLGFGECSLEEVGSGFVDEIKNSKNRDSLMLSNAYLTLSRPIIENDGTRRWKELDMTWESRTQADANEVQASTEKKQWMGEFSSRCRTYFEDQFRNHGVKKFYDIQNKELKAYAKRIRRHIEKKLFDEWLSGVDNSKSILEIEKYTKILIEDCGDRITAFSKQKDRLDEEISNIKLKLAEVNEDWNNIGWLKDAITNKSDKVFSAYKTVLKDYYVAETRIVAYDYAKLLLREIVTELGSMLQGILAFKDRLTKINEAVVKQAGEKCTDDTIKVDTMVKEYNPEMVRTITRQYTTNKDYQRTNSSAIRAKLVENLGEDGEHTFANLFDKTDDEVMSKIILDICEQNAVRAMEETAKSDPISRMVGVNILEKLKQELNSDEKLESFVKEIVALSSTYVQFNEEEKSKIIAGNSTPMMSMLQLCLPAATDSTRDFRAKLVAAFRNHVPGFTEDDVLVNYKSNQIVAISCKSGFPLRFLANLKVLKNKYDLLMAAPEAELNRMVLHTESFEQPLPSLYELDSNEIKKMMIKPLMLAYALDIISEQQDPQTGQRFQCMNIPDAFSDVNWIPLGKDFVDVWDALAHDLAKAEMLKGQVSLELGKRARSNEQKAELKKAVGAVVQQRILPSSLCEGNTFNPNYTLYKNLAIEIFENELKEL